MDRCLDLDGNVLRYGVEVETMNSVERGIEYGDAMVVGKENLDEWEAFECDWHEVGLDVNGDCKEQLANIHSMTGVHTTTEMEFES